MHTTPLIVCPRFSSRGACKWSSSPDRDIEKLALMVDTYVKYSILTVLNGMREKCLSLSASSILQFLYEYIGGACSCYIHTYTYCICRLAKCIVFPRFKGGGLFKEFLDAFAKAAFDPMFGLFLPTSGQLLTPNPASHIVSNHLQYFHFIGKMLGKALYEVATVAYLKKSTEIERSCYISYFCFLIKHLF